MLVYRHNIWCRVDGTREELDWLHKRFTITTQGFWRGHVVIEKRHLFNLKTRRFPGGLLASALKYALDEDKEIEVSDLREVPSLGYVPNFYDKLFDYQKEAIDSAIVGVNGIIQIPTGGGKTFLAVGLASRMRGKTLFLVDDRGLVEQTMTEWKRLTNTEAGVIKGSKTDLRQFTVATMQTLYSRLMSHKRETLEFLSQFVCLIVDEVHVLGAKTKYNVVMNIPAYWRIGLSATPSGRSDKRDAFVVGATGSVLFSLSIDTLVKMGRLAKARVAFYDYPNQTMESLPRQWTKLYAKRVVRDDNRNKAILRLCQVARKPTLLFFIQIRHGKVLLNMCRAAGMKAEIVHGAFDGKSRMALAKALGAGKIDILLASTVFFKGVDIPEIRSAINAAGYKAKIPSIQKLGRAMRVSEGKSTFTYFDLYDRHKRRSRYGEEKLGSLERHSRSRAKTYRDAGLEISKFESLSAAVKWLKGVEGVQQCESNTPTLSTSSGQSRTEVLTSSLPIHLTTLKKSTEITVRPPVLRIL